MQRRVGDFRGEFAAASLKPIDQSSSAPLVACDFRGEFAAASLKRPQRGEFLNLLAWNGGSRA